MNERGKRGMNKGKGREVEEEAWIERDVKGKEEGLQKRRGRKVNGKKEGRVS